MARQKRAAEPDDRDRKVQPPRPPNAWILYRSYKFKLIRDTQERVSQAVVSKRVAEMWRNESEPVRRYWEREAEAKKAEHQLLYPDYRFCPKRKDNKDEKKPKARNATPPTTDANNKKDPGAPPPAPVPAIPAPAPAPPVQLPQPQPHHLPTYHPVPQPYIVPYVPEMPYGPSGPSPPLSAAPSPAGSPHTSSTSSSPSARSSSFAESLASSSSSQPPANQFCPPSIPNPSPYMMQPHPTLLFQSGESPLQHAAHMNGQYYYNSQGHAQVYSESQQGVSTNSSFGSLQGMITGTNDNGVFGLSNINASDISSQPNHNLELAMASDAPVFDLHELFSSEIDWFEFQRRVNLMAKSGSGVSLPVQEDLQSLFQAYSYPNADAYSVQQHHPTVFTDMMHFLNFEAAEDSVGGNSSSASADSTHNTGSGSSYP